MTHGEERIALKDPILLQELTPEDGGGWVALLPFLGSKTFCAVGETADEALENLASIRKHLIEEILAEETLPPPPTHSQMDEFFSEAAYMCRFDARLDAAEKECVFQGYGIYGRHEGVIGPDM